MKNRRELLKAIPFLAAIPFVRIPDDEQERTRKILRHLAEKSDPWKDLLNDPEFIIEMRHQAQIRGVNQITLDTKELIRILHDSGWKDYRSLIR